MKLDASREELHQVRQQYDAVRAERDEFERRLGEANCIIEELRPKLREAMERYDQANLHFMAADAALQDLQDRCDLDEAEIARLQAAVEAYEQDKNACVKEVLALRSEKGRLCDERGLLQMQLEDLAKILGSLNAAVSHLTLSSVSFG